MKLPRGKKRKAGMASMVTRWILRALALAAASYATAKELPQAVRYLRVRRM
jgi:hypothetical protein